MSGGIKVSRPAKGDLRRITDYIAADNIDAAMRVNEAAQATFRLLAGTPGIGRPRGYPEPELVDVRSFPVLGYSNYLIFYRAVSGGIEVLRVIHGMRDVENIVRGPYRR